MKINDPLIHDVSKTICPDHRVDCPDKYTCCKTYTGAYGCCPVVDVCITVSVSDKRLIMGICQIHLLDFVKFGRCLLSIPMILLNHICDILCGL